MTRINKLWSKLVVAVYISFVMVFSYSEGNTVWTKYAASVLFITVITKWIAGGNRPAYAKEWNIIFVWMLLAVLTVLYAIDQQLVLEKSITLFQVIPISFLLYYLIIQDELQIFALITLVAIAVIISVPTYIHPENYSQLGRLMATFNNANLYGLLLVVSIFTCVRLSIRTTNIIKLIFAGILVLFMMYMLIRTGSRKAIITLFISLAIISLMYIHKHLRKKPIAVVLIVSGIFLALAAGSTFLKQSEFFYRFDNLRTSVIKGDSRLAERSDTGRLYLYTKALDTVLENPFGVGLDNFRMVKRDASTLGGALGSYGHSNIIEVAVSTGVIGLLVYCIFYLVLFLRVAKLYRVKWNDIDQAIYDIALLQLLVFVLYDFAMVSYYEKLNWVIMAILIANIHYLSNRKREYQLKRN